MGPLVEILSVDNPLVAVVSSHQAVVNHFTASCSLFFVLAGGRSLFFPLMTLQVRVSRFTSKALLISAKRCKHGKPNASFCFHVSR